MAAERQRRILRFFGPRQDLLAAEAPGLVIYDPAGNVRLRAEVPDFHDIVAVNDELWVAGPRRLTRLSGRDGRELSTEALDSLDDSGRFLQSSTAPHLPVWHGPQPVLVRIGPARTEVPGPGGELIVPIADGRWLLWSSGQLRMWRNIGEAWRRTVGDPGSRTHDAQLVLDGRLVVLAQQRTMRSAIDPDSELRLIVAAISDGAQTTQLRLTNVSALAIAARRGIAVARTGDRLSVLDLRFGRWIRDLVLPEGVTEFAIDDGLQRIALATDDGLELVRPDALAPSSSASELTDEPGPSALTAEPPLAEATNGTVHELVQPTIIEEPQDTQQPDAQPEVDEPLPEEPLVRLDPVSVVPDATAGEIAQAIDLRLQLIGARVAAAIAESWDTGRISRPDPSRHPFADEVAGLLHLNTGRATAELDAAVKRLRTVEDLVITAERSRGGRLTPLDVLARDFSLTPVGVAVLFAIVAPRLRGELARLYGILANDPGRPVVDELLLVQILGSSFADQIARELDGDRPLRKYGLVRVGAGERPFGSLTVDPLVVRYIANQPADGEPDHYLKVRQVDRDLEELQLPRRLIIKALRFLSAPREQEPVRIVVRGRTGAGRHTLLASLASRAGRALGVIDLSTVPREPGRLAQALEAVLRRAQLRGVIPCVDGLELISSEDPDTKVQIGSVLRNHPGPLALRLPVEAQIPLDPGYLTLDLPFRNERERSESWNLALERHQISLSDGSELAARYRVGPGTIERVCSEVSRRPDRPDDPAAWVRELDDAVRQHLENRLGTTANRVTRLANWADVVLPEDIVDSLLELTARVRHRKKVFEQWGFDKSITTARGITALFAGSPGTGKTMVAGVIARDLGLELYRVDVSRITSKWIGETEKNLGSLFDAAEDGQVMLLFDEADSLFAKRTEVKSSVDRYANMEVNYLLQRLDSFEGIAILTTNFGNAIDPAFKRRLTYRVTFPFPDEEMREQLWRAMIPPQVPIAGHLDFAKLSQRFRLSGGYIRNAALRAAFLAAEEGSSLTHDHLERAIRMEFREIGKLAETGTLE
ncbi:MAG: ATP-binding protein [Kofleriaceae bacterium]|nr:ATP-binding protein [Kofleriaceae bacterium]